MKYPFNHDLKPINKSFLWVLGGWFSVSNKDDHVGLISNIFLLFGSCPVEAYTMIEHTWHIMNTEMKFVMIVNIFN